MNISYVAGGLTFALGIINSAGGSDRGFVWFVIAVGLIFGGAILGWNLHSKKRNENNEYMLLYQEAVRESSLVATKLPQSNTTDIYPIATGKMVIPQPLAKLEPLPQVAIETREPCNRCGELVGQENHCPICNTYLGRDLWGTSGANIGGGDGIRITDRYVYVPPQRKTTNS